LIQEKQSHLVQLWPVTLLVRKLQDHESVNLQLLELFRDYQSSHPGKSGSSYVSPDNFSADIESPVLDTLKTFIMDNVYDISRDLNKDYWKQFKLQEMDIDVTGMWFQVSNDGSFHETHTHGNCSWSGVYYVQVGDVSKSSEDTLPNGMLNGVTRFYGPHIDYTAAGHGDWGNYYLHDHTFTSYPQEGTLVIFPSYLKHMAFPYRGDKDRVIVSFHAQVNSKTKIEYSYSFN
jgi:hypothetical protein